jgi:hypothetical protein
VRRNDFAENLLALFTAREVAASIVGDLTEQSHARGRGWFAREVVRLAFALCFKGAVSAPGRALRLAGLGLTVYGGTYVVLFIVAGLPWYPWHRTYEPAFWVRLGLVVVFSNLATGAILAQRPSNAGISAIASLTVVWFTAWVIHLLVLTIGVLGVGRGLVPWPATPPSPWVILGPVLGVPLFGLFPLLLGAVIAQRRIARPTIG